jgi:hypothetical protein
MVETRVLLVKVGVFVMGYCPLQAGNNNLNLSGAGNPAYQLIALWRVFFQTVVLPLILLFTGR